MPITDAQISALKSAVADLKARALALVVDGPVVVEPPPVIGQPYAPKLQTVALDMTSITCLARQYTSDRYERFQYDTTLITDTTTLDFYHTSLAAGGQRMPLRYPQYGLLINGVERARAVVANFGKDSGAKFVVTLVDEADGPAVSQIVAYDAAGARVTSPLGSLLQYGLYIDRTGAAKNAPLVAFQNSSFDWTHGNPNYQFALIPKTALGNQTKPLVPRDAVPFSTALPMTQVVRTNYAPPADNTMCARRPAITDRGITVYSGKQGYFANDTLWPYSILPLLDGPRGAASSEMTLSMYAGRSNKLYGCSPFSLWVMDGTGTKKTLFGQRHKYSIYIEDTRKGHPAVEYIGTPDESVPAGTELYPKECWSIAFDDRSTVTDPNAAPIGGEQPHPGDVVVFLPDSRGWIWKLRFNGHDPNRGTLNPEPPRASIFIRADDPWAVRVKDGIVYATVRNEDRIGMWNADTGAFIGNVVTNSITAGRPPFKFTLTDRVWPGGTALSTLRMYNILAPEGLWLGANHIYWGSYAQREVRRVPVTYGPNGATATGPMEVCFRPYIDEKSRYVLIEQCRTPNEPFGPPETVFSSTWTNSNNAGRPSAYMNVPGVDLDGTPCSHTDMFEYDTVNHRFSNRAAWGWNTLASNVIEGCDGSDSATYSTAVAVGHGALFCSSAEAGIARFLQRDATDRTGLNATKLTAGAIKYRQQLATLYGSYGYGFGNFASPFGVDPDIDYYLTVNGHIAPE